MTRPRRRLVALVALVLVLAAAALAEPVRLEVERGPPPPSPKGGPLLGVARLELNGERIGGLSSIVHVVEAERLLLASDRGWLLEVVPRWDAHGALVGLDRPELRRFSIPRGWSRDVEAMAVDRGQLVIATEGSDRWPHRLLRYAAPLEAPNLVLSDRTVGDLGLRNNRGLEALADLPGGGWLAIGEAEQEGTFPVLARDGRRWRYRAAPDHAPTGADRHGDRLFVLERKVSLLGGWQARITCLPLTDLAAGEVLVPRPVARLGFEDQIDNMEGIAVWQRGDDVEILLVSDDNFSAVQRTLLLQYRWPGGAASGGCGPDPHEQAER